MDQAVDRRQVLKVGAGAAVAVAAAGAVTNVLPDAAGAAPKKPVEKVGRQLGTIGIERLWGWSNKKKKILKAKRVYDGTNNKTLNTGGMCHWIGTPMPLAHGNSVLFGHRTAHGAPLRNTHKMKIGDRIVITIGAVKKEYVVVEPPSVIGSKDFARAINWGDKTKANITLVACTKPNLLPTSTKYRLLIRATEI